MTKEPQIFLQHISESIELIEKRIKNSTHEKFIKNIDLQDMVIRRLEIIGEAVRNLPIEVRRRYKNIKWQDPADMRSTLIHGYFQVDLDIVWDTIINDLPSFKKQIQQMLKDIDKEVTSVVK